MPPPDPVYHVHVRLPGTRRAKLLAGADGSLNGLRIHALRFTDATRARTIAAEITRENPGTTARAVRVRP